MVFASEFLKNLLFWCPSNSKLWFKEPLLPFSSFLSVIDHTKPSNHFLISSFVKHQLNRVERIAMRQWSLIFFCAKRQTKAYLSPLCVWTIIYTTMTLLLLLLLFLLSWRDFEEASIGKHNNFEQMAQAQKHRDKLRQTIGSNISFARDNQAKAV